MDFHAIELCDFVQYIQRSCEVDVNGSNILARVHSDLFNFVWHQCLQLCKYGLPVQAPNIVSGKNWHE